MMNSILVIFPYKKGNIWMFDDDRTGLVQEPFVAGADTLMEKLSGGKTELSLVFSEIEFPDADFKIDFVSGDVHTGTYYHSAIHDHQLWLCPALSKYFTVAPNQIYIRLK